LYTLIKAWPRAINATQGMALIKACHQGMALIKAWPSAINAAQGMARLPWHDWMNHAKAHKLQQDGITPPPAHMDGLQRKEAFRVCG
jgi:hypothetical protein